MAAEQYHVDFETMPWQSSLAGTRFKALTRGGRRLRLVEYTPAMPPHWCDKGHVGYVLHGRMEIRFNHGTIVFNAGDGVFLDAGVEHRHMARAISDVVTVVFVEDI